MRIDFSTTMKQLDGVEIPRGNTPLRLSHVVCDALCGNFDDEKQLSGDEKARRFVIATRIYDQGVVDVSAEDIVLFKKLIGKGFSPLIVGQVFALLDPKPTAVDKSA